MTRMVLTLMIAAAVLISPLFTPATGVFADVLLIEEVRQSEKMQLPVNGMDKDQVRGQFGAPAQTHSPVGDPPITRWDYEQWSVYFEYDLVLFTVLKKGQVIDRN